MKIIAVTNRCLNECSSNSRSSSRPVTSHLREKLRLNLHKNLRPFLLQNLRPDEERGHESRSFGLAVVIADSMPAPRRLEPETALARGAKLSYLRILPALPRLIDFGLFVVHRRQDLTIENVGKYVGTAMTMSTILRQSHRI